MGIITEKVDHQFEEEISPEASPPTSLQIAICPPEFQPLVEVMSGESTDATYIIQNYISSGLQARGHKLTFLAPNNVEEIVCTSDLLKPRIAPQTWSASRWFDVARRGTWQVQRYLGVPYLNLFSNYRLFDACLRCLPGHDLVYERNSLYRFGVAMACKRLGLPYVVYFEADDILEHDFMGKPITGVLGRRARAAAGYNLNTTDCVICVSEPGKAHLIKNWGVPAEKIVVFPNGVDVGRFRPDPGARSEVRASLGIGSNPLIIFVGSFYKWHDVATLLDAFAQLMLAHPDARLLLVGEGEKRQMTVQGAANLGISDNVCFTGQVPHSEVPRLMAAADIAVVPYPPMDRDLWLSPLKLFEYMASGTAVVASAVGQLTEIIQDGINGLLVPPGDASAMTAALKRLIEEPSLRSRLSQHAREDAVSDYSWEGYILRLERLLNAVIAGEPVNLI